MVPADTGGAARLRWSVDRSSDPDPTRESCRAGAGGSLRTPSQRPDRPPRRDPADERDRKGEPARASCHPQRGADDGVLEQLDPARVEA